MIVGPVELTGIAHGGAAIGRFEGRVLFVRGAIPGETAMVRVSDASKAAWWRGEVAELMVASEHRVVPPCPIAGRCGGCDFQHVSVEHQRELKRQVVAEQLQRLAAIDWHGHVEAVDSDALGWRTRMRYHRDAGGLGLRGHRSHAVVPLPAGGCAIAHPAGRGLGVGGDETELRIVVADSGVAINGAPSVVRQRVHHRWFEVAADGFWQVHPRAAEVLVDAVLAGADVHAGDQVLDLYCGAGLFSAFLADRGAGVVGVEGDRRAVSYARRNAVGEFVVGDVATVLRGRPGTTDVVVLDPPRAGAGREVVAAVVRREPRAVVYVACDPAALARDLATFAAAGYVATDIRAFDLFPMTHHVECVATLKRSDRAD